MKDPEAVQQFHAWSPGNARLVFEQVMDLSSELVRSLLRSPTPIHCGSLRRRTWLLWCLPGNSEEPSNHCCTHASFPPLSCKRHQVAGGIDVSFEPAHGAHIVPFEEWPSLWSRKHEKPSYLQAVNRERLCLGMELSSILIQYVRGALVCHSLS